jgi:preprotein translocase subunit YajC
MEQLAGILPLLLMLAVFYFIIIMPQRKRDKKHKAMIAALEKGADIVTIGGIEGKVISVKDDVVTIETGMDRTKLSFKKWAIKEVVEKEKA